MRYRLNFFSSVTLDRLEPSGLYLDLYIFT